MLVRPAESSFRRGMEALAHDRGIEALALFEAALEIEGRYGAGAPQARYRSYYGLCLALESNRVREGIQLCREAIGREYYNPDLYLNLGRVLLGAGRRREAYEAIRSGLVHDPGHGGLLRELQRMGRRRRPIVPFLSRRNPVNVLLGRLRRARLVPTAAH